MTDYETIRRQNMERNKLMLQSLGLGQPAPVAPSNPPVLPKVLKRTYEEEYDTRKSTRIEGKHGKKQNVQDILVRRIPLRSLPVELPNSRQKRSLWTKSFRKPVQVVEDYNAEMKEILEEDEEEVPEMPMDIIEIEDSELEASYIDNNTPEERSLFKNPVLMFTSIEPSLYEGLKKLGATFEKEDISLVTHLVSDGIKRTSKFLSALCYPVPKMCLPSWCEDCLKEGYFLDETPYFINDEATETKHGFSLAKSLKYAAHRRVFQGYRFYLTSSCPKELYGVVRNGGGLVVPLPPTMDRKIIVITPSTTLDRSLVDLVDRNNVFDVNLIVFGALQQNLDFTAWRVNQF